MVLRFGEKRDEVKPLQRGLNKLGEMLVIDGHFGRSTRNALGAAREELQRPGSPEEADDDLQQAIAAFPDPFPPLTAAGVTFIAREEVSDAATYRKKHQTATLPPSPSGITIGIGYDCRFATREQLNADWQDVLPAEMLDRLVPTLGKVGTPILLEQAAGVVVPLGTAMTVFTKRSLPKYLAQTRGIYPQVDAAALTSAQRTALVSLIYNRGTDLEGDRRREMRTIRDLLAAERFDEIPEQFESMTRLWDPAKAAGLIRRRRSEAILWRSGFAALQLE